jgi:hypothetical protein
MKPGLQHFFDTMAAYFQEPAGLERLYGAHPGWDAPRERVALYGDFVRGHVHTITRKLYPLTRALVGEPRWEALVEAYRATRPARHFELNRLGEGFPAFLADEAGPRGLPPSLPALARFEWTDFQVYASEEGVPARVERLTVNPTLAVLQHPFRICACVRAKAATPPEPGEEMALLWRHPEQLTTFYMAASDSALLVLKMALEGLCVAEVAAATGVPAADIQGAIDTCARDGLVLVPPG